MAADDSCPVPQPVLRPVEQLDPETKALVDRIGHGVFYGQLGHAPEVIQGWMRFYQPIMLNGRVEVRTKELCRLRIATLNGCHY
jgi:hypothetical protein